jgi:MYXO-CTERM domain-containing protein
MSGLTRSVRARTVLGPFIASLCTLAASGPAGAAIVSGRVVLQTGDAPTGGPLVTDVFDPFVNDSGQVGFVGTLDDGDHFVFVEDTVVWLGSNDVVLQLDNPESTMGSSGLGTFVYSPEINGVDGLYTDAGILALAGDQAVGFPMGATYLNHRIPSMTADGSIFWIADVDGGGAEPDVQGLYFTSDGTPGNIELLLRGGDAVGAFFIDDATAGSDGGIDSDYAVSADGAHRIHVLDLDGDSASDGVVWVDGAIVTVEGDATGGGDGWDNFDLVAINANGNYLVTGNTNGPVETDEYIAYNGTLAIREGDSVGGVTLQTNASLRFASINDQDQATFAWGYQMAASFRESVFFSCNAADLANSSLPVLTTSSDGIDVDGDLVGDYSIEDILGATAVSGKAMGETPFVYVELELDDGKVVTQGIVEIPVICCGNGLVDPMEECDDTNTDNEDDCLDTCLAASCGDGVIQTGVEECDDGNDDDTDDCPSSCVPATCGDGFVQDGVEECDDGNDDDTDDCRTDCTLPPTGTTGLDDTAGAGSADGSGSADASGTGGGNDVNPDGGDTLSTSAGETDTDTAGAGDDGGGGCGCRTGERPVTGLVWSVLGLGLLGLARRRR